MIKTEKLKEKNINTFSEDTNKYGSYQYTQAGKFSSQLANKHITEKTIKMISLKSKKVIDIGCGDGTYTIELAKKEKPKKILGFDPSTAAINKARQNSRGISNVTFVVGNIYRPPRGPRYDVAIVRGVLHHVYQPELALRQISNLAKNTLIIEPNGYNPILKIIERISPYHRKHEERSFPPHLLMKWAKNTGMTCIKADFAGLVPFFCPEKVAKVLKKVEPLIEKLPLINYVLCGNYYLLCER